MHHRTIKDVPSGMKSKKSLPGIEHTNFTRSSSGRKNTTRMSTNKTSSEVTSLQRRSTPRQDWRDTPKKECTWWTVALRYIWRDYLLWRTQKRRRFDSQPKFWIFRPPMALWSRTHKRRYTWGERLSVSAIVGETMQSTWLLLFVADRRNSQIIKRWERNRMQHRTLRPHGCSCQTEGSTIHWVFDSQGKPWARTFTEGFEEREASSSTPTAGAHAVVEEQSHDEKLPSVATDAGCDILTKNTKRKKMYYRLPTKRKPQCVHSLSERPQLWGS